MALKDKMDFMYCCKKNPFIKDSLMNMKSFFVPMVYDLGMLFALLIINMLF